MSFTLLQVKNIYIHSEYIDPYFGTANPEFDIALLKLQHPVRLTDSVGLICLPSEAQDPPSGTMCTVTGWGHHVFGGNWSPDVLHKADVPLVSLRSVTWWAGLIVN